MRYEAYCEKCGKVLDTSEDISEDKYARLVMSAQFKRCPDCHKNQDFAYFQIGVRPMLLKGV